MFNVKMSVYRGEWGRLQRGTELQYGLFLQSRMSYSDDIHTAHVKSAPPHPSWMKSGTCDHSFYKKKFIVKNIFFY